jgi:hypothetical protein
MQQGAHHGGRLGRRYAVDVLEPVLQNVAADYYLKHIKVDPDFIRLGNNPRFTSMIAAAEARLARLDVKGKKNE